MSRFMKNLCAVCGGEYPDHDVAHACLSSIKRTHPPDVSKKQSPMNATGVEARVCEDIAKRQHHGTLKYGTTVDSNPLPLRAWLQHAYEEALDMAVYLRRSMEELEKKSDDFK